MEDLTPVGAAAVAATVLAPLAGAPAMVQAKPSRRRAHLHLAGHRARYA
ncbi:hypothetical protein ACIA8K_30040 [Catenuloplanes sp. NPDC051500]